VLREEARPMVRVHGDDVTPTRVREARRCVLLRSDCLQCLATADHDPWVCRIEEEPQAVGPGSLRDTPVTEVEPKQVRIVSGRQVDAAWMADWARTSRWAGTTVPARHARYTPFPDRAARNPGQPSYDTVRMPGCNQGQRAVRLPPRSHEHMFALTSDGEALRRPSKRRSFWQ
jgi:hypothetical protein